MDNFSQLERMIQLRACRTVFANRMTTSRISKQVGIRALLGTSEISLEDVLETTGFKVLNIKKYVR